MRDTISEELREELRSLWTRFKAHCEKEYPKDSEVTFLSASNSVNESRGTIVGLACDIGYVRVRYHRARPSRRMNDPYAKVRDIAIKDLCTIVKPEPKP